MHELDFEKIRQRLREELPGEKAQLKMASTMRSTLNLRSQPDQSTRLGAVLILFYPKNGTMHIPLIQRPVYKGVHSGQVAFPGGQAEAGDQDLTQTALREAQEEIGVNPAAIDILGSLTPLFVPASNFMVHPVVGFTRHYPDFKPDAYEVEAVLEVPLDELRDITRIGSKEITIRAGVTIQAPFYDLQSHTVWGATAMMISELLEVV